MAPRLYVFDVDRTLLKHNCSFRFYFYLLSQGFFSIKSLALSIPYYLRFRFFNMSILALHEKVFFHFLEGQNYPSIAENGRFFLQKFLDEMFYKPCVAHFEKAKKEGCYTMLLSSSPDFMIEPIAEKLEAHSWQATRYSLDKDQNLSGISNLVEGQEKLRHVQAVARQLDIAYEDIVAYSDSITDLPLMEYAGTAVAVNPDRRLKKIAEKRSWLIL